MSNLKKEKKNSEKKKMMNDKSDDYQLTRAFDLILALNLKK